ncbi:hypothetical protein GS396_07130 [Stenotrophomonas maltophilia]|nr:hypothetical protein [Stenotrophomonas geniculata]QHE20671.1 hypothetical protein GS396_07130 [Stenotrophomonas maltophilia]
MNNRPIPTFWHWFFHGVAKKPGYRRVANAWGLFHLGIGGFAAFAIEVDFQDLAKSALLPLMAILVALTFSWAGNVNSIMQTEEVRKFLEEKGGPVEYVFTFQLCILINIAVICAWCVPLLDLPYLLPEKSRAAVVGAMEAVLFAAVSLAIRTGWHAVVGSNMLLLEKLR